MSEKKQKNFWGSGLILLFLLLSLSLWSNEQLKLNYQNLERSNYVIESLLDGQSQQMRAYKRELDLFKINLDQTEGLLAKVQEENQHLHKKVLLLDQVAELEHTISRLKEKNALLINQMSSVSRIKEVSEEDDIATIAQGKALMVKYRDKLSGINRQINSLRQVARLKRIDMLREKDQKLLAAGNNGYLLREGQVMEVDLAQALKNRNVKIDVTFVK